MNILITIYHSLGYGGAEVSTSLLAKQLEKLGNKVIIASTQPYEGLDTRLFKKFKLPFYGCQEFYLSKFLRKLIKKENIDIIYPQDKFTSIPAIIAAKRENKRVIVHFRDYWYACPRSSCLTPDFENYDVCNYKIILKKYPKYRLIWDLYKWAYIKRSWKILEKADAKVVSSNMEKEKLELCNIKENVKVIPISRDIKIFEKADGKAFRKKYNFKKYIITFVGSLFYTKGVSILVEIIPRVIKENKDISFLIIGNGPMESNLRKMIKENNLEENVIMTGRLPIEKVAEAYSISDAVLLPVVWREPFSGVPLEVGAAGKALITSDIGAIREMKGDFKLLVEPFDYDGWKNAILRVVKDKKLRDKLGSNGKKMVKNYSVEKISKRINDLLYSI